MTAGGHVPLDGCVLNHVDDVREEKSFSMLTTEILGGYKKGVVSEVKQTDMQRMHGSAKND